MSVKLIAFDLDGTIIKEDRNTITDLSLEAIEYAKRNNKIVVVATGRMLSALPDIIRYNKNIDYFITANGAKLQDSRTLEKLHESGIKYDKVKELIELADRLDIFYELYSDGLSYAPKENKDKINNYNIRKEFFEILYNRPKEYGDLNELINRGQVIDKFNMLSIPQERYQEVWSEFSKIKDINQVSSIKINIEINSIETNKWQAINKLCEIKNINSRNVMTIGDSGNDYEMIKRAGYGIAMGNSYDEVKEVAKYITDTIEEDGFYNAVKKYIK